MAEEDLKWHYSRMRFTQIVVATFSIQFGDFLYRAMKENRLKPEVAV